MAQEAKMSEPAGGARGAGLAPPVEGLGNYKGVMLCNRPQDPAIASKPGGGVPGDAATPFRSTVSATHNEALGMCPSRGDAPARPPPKPKGNPVLKRHMRWLKDLQDELAEQRQEVQQSAGKETDNFHNVRAFCAKHRDGVRQMLDEAKEEFRLKEEEEKKNKKAHRPTKGKKPTWAMTEEAAAVHDEEEDDALIGFVENLDFDSYINDLEFREAVKVVKDRAGRLKQEQDAFKDELARDLAAADGEEEAPDGTLWEEEDERGSAVGELPDFPRRRRAAGDGDDDAASVAASEVSVRSEASARAKEVLAANPQMRAIHSKASVERLIEKQQATADSAAA